MFLPEQQEVENGHEQHVQRGDEARFACRRVDDARLLEETGGGEKRAAAEPADHGAAARAPLRLGRTAHLAPPLQQGDRSHGRGGERHPGRGEGERLDALHAHALCDKGAAPYDRGQSQKDVAKQFFVFHIRFGRAIRVNCRVTVCRDPSAEDPAADAG